MSQLLQDLRKVRELLSEPKRWTKGCMARDVNGLPVSRVDPDAASWCLEGAGGRVCGSAAEFEQYLDALGAECRPHIGFWNDLPKRTHAEVLAMLDRAIAKEEANV